MAIPYKLDTDLQVYFIHCQESCQSSDTHTSLAYMYLCQFGDIDRFNSVFHHRNWRVKVSCDVDINQSAGSMVM